jgi:hypothetical protein
MSTVLKIQSQFYEHNLGREFDVQFPGSMVNSIFGEEKETLLYGADSFNDSSFIIKQAMFPAKLKSSGIDSNYYLH